jgi:hypothetical protein
VDVARLSVDPRTCRRRRPQIEGARDAEATDPESDFTIQMGDSSLKSEACATTA